MSRPTGTYTQQEATRISGQRMLQYMGQRYGQRPETRERYDEAVKACSNIEYLDKTVSEIARLFDLEPESFRNQLKRHFPDVIPNRDKLRRQLGLTKQPMRGLSPSTTAKYAPAIAMLRETTLTIREVAEKCKVSVHGLQQHLLFYHKDVAEKRLRQRTDALAKPLNRGDKDAANRTVGPKPETEALYADAVELYRTTERTATDIAVEQGLDPHNFMAYLQRWYRDEISVRQKLRQEQAEERRRQRQQRKENSRIVKAERKYAPALPLIEAGATYDEAALQTGVPTDRLAYWVRHHRPDLNERARQNAWVTLPNGTRIMRSNWPKFQEAEKAYCNTDESIKHIAKRLGMSPTTLLNFLHAMHPEVVLRRREERRNGHVMDSVPESPDGLV